MLPYSLCRAAVSIPGKKTIDCSLEELSPGSFSFKLPADTDIGERDILSVLLIFRTSLAGEETEVRLSDAAAECVGRHPYWKTWRVRTEDPSYRTAVLKFSRHYLEYIEKKQSLTEAEFSQWAAGYPAAREEEYAKNFPEWKRNRFSSSERLEAFAECCAAVSERALWAETPEDAALLLREGWEAFRNALWERSGLGHTALRQLPVEVLYIGSETCPRLLPSKEIAEALGGLLLREQIRPAAVLPPLRTGEEERMAQFLLGLSKGYGTHVEVIFNDEAALRLLKEQKIPAGTLRAGTMFCRLSADPRESFLPRNEDADCFLHSGERIFDFGSADLSRENAPYIHTALHVPYIRTNTAGNCTLRAAVQDRDRGTVRQGCSGECRDRMFLYPELLGTVGIANAVYCVRPELLSAPQMHPARFQNTDRVVFQLF